MITKFGDEFVTKFSIFTQVILYGIKTILISIKTIDIDIEIAILENIIKDILGNFDIENYKRILQILAVRETSSNVTAESYLIVSTARWQLQTGKVDIFGTLSV